MKNKNVKSHGAKGDGITDDTTSIQKAINACGSNLHFPKGTYLTSKSINIPNTEV